jgi:hypothetical protein
VHKVVRMLRRRTKSLIPTWSIPRADALSSFGSSLLSQYTLFILQSCKQATMKPGPKTVATGSRLACNIINWLPPRSLVTAWSCGRMQRRGVGRFSSCAIPGSVLQCGHLLRLLSATRRLPVGITVEGQARRVWLWVRVERSLCFNKGGAHEI